jgi:hypothetical protein
MQRLEVSSSIFKTEKEGFIFNFMHTSRNKRANPTMISGVEPKISHGKN